MFCICWGCSLGISIILVEVIVQFGHDIVEALAAELWQLVQLINRSQVDVVVECVDKRLVGTTYAHTVAVVKLQEHLLRPRIFGHGDSLLVDSQLGGSLHQMSSE